MLMYRLLCCDCRVHATNNYHSGWRIKDSGAKGLRCGCHIDRGEMVQHEGFIQVTITWRNILLVGIESCID